MLKDHVQFRKEGRHYVREDAGTIEYSDGSDVEQYLKIVLENARDLSSHSVELQYAVQDWASEYHLASERANLLRGFDFAQCRTVLELGCGCGAISRFLGEQGLVVDAVEGSPARAELAALRCRDLENVSVYCANFNTLDLPLETYDLICLVGVTEYAARFTEGDGAEQPVARLLKVLTKSLTRGGVVMVAIENRTGMKYVLGAHEDHYAKRFVGINEYFGVQDINTYTLSEWERIFQQAGVRDRKVYLPFPDYKLPRVVLSQHFVRHNPYAYCNLEGLESRDYVDIFKPPIRESLFWQSASGNNTLDDYANSFLFVLDMKGTGIPDSLSVDFAHLPSFSRRRDCCLVTVKPEHEPVVRRRKLIDTEFKHPFVSQQILEEPYHRGTLLSVLWSRALEIEPESDRFMNLVKQFVSYLSDRKKLSIDLTASNIVVDGKGAFHAFDEEWVVAEPVSRDFLLFRALLIFVVNAGASIRLYAYRRDIETVREFIEYVGDRTGVDLRTDMNAYIDLEEKFQNAIAVERSKNPTRALLEKSVRDDPKYASPIRMRLYWRKAREPYSEECSRQVLVENQDGRHIVTMALPPSVAGCSRFRFNPVETVRDDGVGFMRIYRVNIDAVDPTSGERTTIWSCAGPDQIAEYATMSGMKYASSALGKVFMVTADDAELDFEFIPRVKPGPEQFFEFTAELTVARSRDYLLARGRYVTTQERLERRLKELDGLEESHRRTSEELTAIKNSDFWRLFDKYRSTRERLDALSRKLSLWAALAGNLGWRRTMVRAYRQGTRRALRAFGRKPEVEGPPTRYEIWRDLRMPRENLRSPANGPLISVVMPVYDAPGGILAKAVKSVEKQSYRNWELCIADDGSTNSETLAVLRKLNDTRIKTVTLPENRNISAATNAAAALASGEYLAFMDNDDELDDDALSEIAGTIAATGAECLYTDEDFIRADGHLDLPHFKPDYNPDMLLSHNYITHLLVVKKDLFHEVGELRSEYDGAQDYDLLLRVVEKANRVEHVSKPLYHWRMSDKSTSLNPNVKPGGHGNARRALEDALRRRGIDGSVEETRLPHYFRLKRKISNSPRVSIIIPFRDKPELLRQCVTTILQRTAYPEFEVLGISNDSTLPQTYDEMEDLSRCDGRIRFVELNEEFNFSRLVNYGVEQSTGDHALLLNNDIEVINPDWIEALLEHSQRGEIAAVGGKLYYPNNTIQHAGIAIGLGGYAGHPHQRFRADAPGYFNRLNVIRNVSAVTGAMMMVERRKYEEIGLFDEKDFGIAYNDVDFCLRAVEAGYLNVFTPYAEAYHRESASRGYEDTPEKETRFSREKENLLKRHGEAIRRGDPYYNRNFDQRRDDFRFSIDPILTAKV